MHWVDKTDLRLALSEVAAVLDLTITDKDYEALHADLSETWYLDEPWATLHHSNDSPRFELSEDECGGVFIRMNCDDSARRRVVEVLARFNPLIK